MKALRFLIGFALLAATSHAAQPHIPGKVVEGNFETIGLDFLEYHCFECHDDVTAKADLNLLDLGPVDETNTGLWKSIWAQVALQEMPPKKKEQPSVVERLQFTDWILNELKTTMKDKGGFHAHQAPNKGNFIDHDLLFGELPEGIQLKPTFSPRRIWRVTPSEHITRLNELINTEPKYDPENRGLRTHGDAVSLNHGGELKLYFGADRINSWVGGTVAYATSIKSVPAVLSSPHKHGFENYAEFSSVNSAESTQILNKAGDILRYMAYGPESIVSDPRQITDRPAKFMLTLSGKGDVRGTPLGLTYHSRVIRPLTPLYELLKEPKLEYSDSEILKVIEHLFEMLTFRPSAPEEAESYLQITRDTIAKIGNERGLFMGLSAIFLDRDALFFPELAAGEFPDEHGRVMLQDWELGLAVNRALRYLKPDPQLRQAIVNGGMRTREDVKREVTRMLADDRIRKPRVLQFFREYFDYDLAEQVCKDESSLAGMKLAKNAQDFREKMLIHTISTDRLVELILEEDKDVLRELLTTQKIVVSPQNNGFYPGGRSREPKRGLPVDRPENTPESRSGIKRDLKKEGNTEADKINLYRKFNENKYGDPDGVNPQEEAVAERKWKKRSDTPGEVRINARVGYRSFGKGSLKANRFLRVAPEGQRLGILTQPSWLVAHSDAMDNHAIHRGIWIRQRLLGGGIPDVPITVDAQLPDEPGTPLRERMRVTRATYCWSCHEKMDPLGLPFEMYNHVGLLEKITKKNAIDTTGEIIDSGDLSLDGPIKNAHEMINKLADSERVEQVFVRHAFRYWMGRNETLHDRATLQAAHNAYRDSGGSMNALIVSLVTSDAFLYRR